MSETLGIRVEVLPIEQAATPDPLRFTASVAQVKTMADGGIRLAIDLPETAIDIAAAMMRAKQAGAVLECAVMAIVKPPINLEKTDERINKRYSPYTKTKA